MKKILSLVIAGLVLVLAAAPTLAVELKPVEVIAEPIPFPACRDVVVRPGKPLRLAGTGTLSARGWGEVHFNMRSGFVSLEGRGIAAVKASNNDTVNVSGMGKKMEIGEWAVYWGTGKLSVRGDDYQIIAFGRLSIRARGTGSASFEGWWKVHYCRLLIAEPIPIPKIIPESLKATMAE